jgi:hypothetical protein
MKSEWKTSPLRDLVGFISKGIAPSYADEESETTVRVLNQKCNRNFRITYSESRLHDLSRKKVPTERFVRIDDILINSTGAGTAGRIAQICNLPCDTIVDGHMMIERVKQNKSLVDVMLISRTCQEHYKNNVDSFILVSSDSDYWGLISSLQDARFLVMIERESCGPDLKNALSDAGIFYCYIDDFYSGNTEDIKQGALFKEMYRYIDNAVRLNIFEMFDEAIRTTRIEMSSAEKQQFISQYVKTMQMRITDSGDVVLEFKRK